MSRILIVTNGPLARNPRVFKEASALGNAGHDVTVLTPRNHAPSEPFDQALCADAPFKRQPIDLIPGYSLPRWRIFLRMLGHRLGREAMFRLSWPTLHALGPAGIILRFARRHPADLTIVHNEVPHGIGLRLMREGRRVAADIEDWHSEDLPVESRRNRPINLLRRQERDLLIHAVYCTTTSNAMADALHARYGGRRPDVIGNVFPLSPARVPEPGPARLLWFSQTIGPGRGLESFLAAWAGVHVPSECTLVGEDHAGYAAHLRDRLPASHASRLRIHPLISPLELPAFIARHDIGLALEPHDPANKNFTISNKILQYLNAGLAVVASDTAGQREVLAHDPAAGLVVNLADTTSVTHALYSLLSDPDALRARQRAARRLAETRYCWELESTRLVKLVERSLA